MAILRPFRALRPTPANAVRVASPPYDVINTAEARALAAGNPDSYLRVSRPEIDLPEGTDEHSDAVYEQGKRNLQELVERGKPLELQSLFLEPLLSYINEILSSRQANETITIVVPHTVPDQRIHNALHMRTAEMLHRELLSTPGIVITEVPYQVP